MSLFLKHLYDVINLIVVLNNVLNYIIILNSLSIINFVNLTGNLKLSNYSIDKYNLVHIETY